MLPSICSACTWERPPSRTFPYNIGPAVRQKSTSPLLLSAHTPPRRLSPQAQTLLPDASSPPRRLSPQTQTLLPDASSPPRRLFIKPDLTFFLPCTTLPMSALLTTPTFFLSRDTPLHDGASHHARPSSSRQTLSHLAPPLTHARLCLSASSAPREVAVRVGQRHLRDGWTWCRTDRLGSDTGRPAVRSPSLPRWRAIRTVDESDLKTMKNPVRSATREMDGRVEDG
ncbi:hypothetical protein B0H17DRAFT_137678 [Mycena rosella]|uniref:Uncharacterized protein n=1 Tax=Mycena rosella TaxID=1033263 RepID=A0AAD7E0R3_MYCRO|nr:hypothetical protein B0H17DRAFT_137678 [Mycena rosella]